MYQEKTRGEKERKKKREFEGNKNITQVDKMNTGQEEGKFIDLTCVCVCLYKKCLGVSDVYVSCYANHPGAWSFYFNKK